MNLAQWWPNLSAATRQWLLDHVGQTLPPRVLADIASAGGTVTSDAWWSGQIGPSGFFVSADAADWFDSIDDIDMDIALDLDIAFDLDDASELWPIDG